MIQKIKGRGFILGALIFGVILSSGGVCNLNADPVQTEVQDVEAEFKDLETDLKNYEEETDTAFGDALPNTYSLDAGDPVGEGV
ncbi:MAG: hypothetical protein B7Y25_00635 [Alphaproteobacteria bacterium 16-39-46]|nr:MAG: hypothetical protein B7Y25_00635 [Alphaproteobacteria bacterium 16-39-46]OZA44346.1 MAG: hypothetical protein B7X84_00640 [Alphaproteobacteria bacterium 17-39-52]HQS83416.1 hypothetical protein [Alphaproteobacteria bacterium]HQS93180.1 hypothetical protein [Alphaproteobacteria bacterium]